MKLSHLIFIGSALASSTAFAAVASREATARLPAEMVQGQVRYVSGGIGQAEARAFRRAERHYPLALEFANKAKPHDEFTADIKVVIRDANGNVMLDTVSGGPLLLAKLPAGGYEIKATQGDKTLIRRVTLVEGVPIRAGFRWNADHAGQKTMGDAP